MNQIKPIRLHKLVTQYLKTIGNTSYSQPEIQRNIQNYGVRVGGQLLTKRLEWVWTDQAVDISTWPVRQPGNLSAIRVLEEHPDYLLIYKPANLAVQPGTGHQFDNLVTWLIAQYPEQEQLLYQSSYLADTVGNRAPLPRIINPSAGLVHRLDKDAQGLLLVARNLPMLDFLQNQFRARSAIKKYLAIVDGLLTQQVRIQTWQARSKRDPTKQKLFWTATEAHHYDATARDAESIFRPLLQCPTTNQTLVEVQIKTGRMHQIRLQAQHLGHPLSQDPIYHQMLEIPKKFLASTTASTACPIQFKNVEQVRNVSALDFNRLKATIFADANFCLLSNHLTVQLPSGTLSRTLHPVQDFESNHAPNPDLLNQKLCN